MSSSTPYRPGFIALRPGSTVSCASNQSSRQRVAAGGDDVESQPMTLMAIKARTFQPFGNTVRNKRPQGKDHVHLRPCATRCEVQTTARYGAPMLSSEKRRHHGQYKFASNIAHTIVRSCSRISYGFCDGASQTASDAAAVAEDDERNDNNDDCTKTCRNLPNWVCRRFSRVHCTGLYDENNVRVGRVVVVGATSPRSGKY
jgi:hypothetical protein